MEPRYGAPGNGLPSDHEALHDPRPGDARLVYAPSLYSLACERDARYEPDRDHTVTRWEGARTEELSRAPMALVLGEWGFDWTFPRADLCGRNVMAMADRLRAGWAYWSDSTGTWGAHRRDRGRAPRRERGGVPLSARHHPPGFDVRLSPGWSRTYDEDRERLHVAPVSADVATDTVVEFEVVPREP